MQASWNRSKTGCKVCPDPSQTYILISPASSSWLLCRHLVRPLGQIRSLSAIRSLSGTETTASVSTWFHPEKKRKNKKQLKSFISPPTPRPHCLAICAPNAQWLEIGSLLRTILAFCVPPWIYTGTWRRAAFAFGLSSSQGGALTLSLMQSELCTYIYIHIRITVLFDLQFCYYRVPSCCWVRATIMRCQQYLRVWP